jgi:hypothetical protein
MPPMELLRLSMPAPAGGRWRHAAAWLMHGAALGGMWVFVWLSPLAVALISRRWQPLQRYVATVRQCARMLGAMHTRGVIYRNALRKLQGDAYRAPHIEGECTHCGRCCIDRQCVFLDWRDGGETSSCTIYGSRFFRWTSCGEYPITGEDIAVYACPSFRAVPAGTQRVIPIRAE